MGFEEWFKKSSDSVKKTVKEEYDHLKEDYNKATDKAGKARFEDDLAKNFIEEDFVKAVLAGQIVFAFKEKKKVRSFFNNYDKSIWQSGFECFEFILHHTTEGDLMEFKVNHSQERLVNLFRLNNVIRHGVDKTDAEPKMGIYKYM
jgi:hypothetical protein